MAVFLFVELVGFEGYRKKLNNFKFFLTPALEEERSMCRRHDGATEEKESHPPSQKTAILRWLFFYTSLNKKPARCGSEIGQRANPAFAEPRMKGLA